MMDENDRYQEYFDYFSDQLSMDLLKKDYLCEDCGNIMKAAAMLLMGGSQQLKAS